MGQEAPLGTLGDLGRHLGTLGDLGGHLGTRGHLGGHSGTLGHLGGHLGTLGHLGGHFASFGILEFDKKKNILSFSKSVVFHWTSFTFRKYSVHFSSFEPSIF